MRDVHAARHAAWVGRDELVSSRPAHKKGVCVSVCLMWGEMGWTEVQVVEVSMITD